MEYIKLCNDEVLADHPVGNLVIKKPRFFAIEIKVDYAMTKSLRIKNLGIFAIEIKVDYAMTKSLRIKNLGIFANGT